MPKYPGFQQALAARLRRFGDLAFSILNGLSRQRANRQPQRAYRHICWQGCIDCRLHLHGGLHRNAFYPAGAGKVTGR